MRRFGFATAAALALLSCVGTLSAAEPRVQQMSEMMVVRVYYEDVGDIPLLRDFDLWEYRDRVEHYVLINADADDLARVRALGFRAEIDFARTAELQAPRDVIEGGGGIPGYPCYRTVEETYATAEQIVADNPTLATWSDIGDTWEKINGLGGWDIKVLRLTNSAIGGVKPKLIATCSIHAREYTPAELCTRFAELLAGGYGVDPDVTWMLDYQEVHLVLMTNPDGRKMAETGLSWRKNTNQNYCSPTSNNRGADLNRNFEFEWGCCNGSTGSQCGTTYRGPSPASEPETQTVQAYLRAEFPDQRGANLSDPAPPGSTGVYLDIHASGQLVLWPWGFPGAAPNSVPLTTLGRKFAWLNGHYPEQSIDLYPTDGTTVDFAYGDLGVAAFTFELGTAFFQNCSYFESSILSANLDAMLYAARVARTPYLTPAGPDTLGVAIFPAFVEAGDSVDVTASADDTRFSDDNGTEPTQAVAEARYYLGLPWGLGADPGQPMSPADGSFDEAVEFVAGSADTTGLSGGRHPVYVRARDDDGNWGAFAAAFLWIRGGPEGSVQGTVTESGTGAGIEATVGVDSLGFSVQSNPADGSFDLPLPPGTWTVHAGSPYYTGQSVGSIVVTDGAVIAQDFVLDLIDADDDGVADALDCAAADPSVWSVPGPASGLLLSDAPVDNLVWVAPAQPGGLAGASYDVLRATDTADFGAAACLESGIAATSATDGDDPAPGSLYLYLIRAANACGSTLGAGSNGVPRTGALCP